MPAPIDDPGIRIHPGVWGVIGAGVLSVGRMGVAWLKGLNDKRGLKLSVSDKMDKMIDDMGYIRQNMATREDVATVTGKIDEHIHDHATHKFDPPAHA